MRKIIFIVVDGIIKTKNQKRRHEKSQVIGSAKTMA
jgi:hypothetical protein